jgi:hypothetical protein
VFDNFVRWPEWSSRQKAMTLEQEVVGLRGHTRELEEELRNASVHAADLEKQLETTRTETGNQLERIRQLEAELSRLSVRKTFGRLFSRLRNSSVLLAKEGVRGLPEQALKAILRRTMSHPRLMALGRALLKPFPKFTTNLYRLATKSEPVAAIGEMPASARSTYLRLKAAMSDSDSWTRTQ